MTQKSPLVVFGRGAATSAVVLLLLLPAWVPVAAETQDTGAPPPSLEAVLGKWTDALGGKRRLDKIRSIHRRMSGRSAGLNEVVDEWVTATGRRRVHSNRGADETTTVFDGRRGLVVDWNGFVRALESDETRSQAGLALAHGIPPAARLAGSAELAGAEAETGLLTIKFSPPSGHPLTYFLDPKTYLPSRVKLSGGVTIAFSDWRDVDGLRLPFAEQRRDARDTVDYRVEAMELNPSEGGRFDQPRPGAKDAFFIDRNRPAAMPFNFENDHVMLQTSVNGRPPVWFMVDTGAKFTVISQEWLDQFGLQTYGGLKTQGGGNAVSGAFVAGVTCRVGPVEVRDQHAAVLSLHGLEQVYGMPLGGILGWDFISRFVMEIDYPTRTVTFHDPATYKYRGKGSVVPLTLEGNLPYMEGSITVKGRPIPAHWVLDVGAADTFTLTAPYVDRHDLVELAGDPRQSVRTLAGSEKQFFAPTTVRGLVDELRLGPVKMPHVIGNLSRGRSGAYGSDAFAGTIGEALLKRFRNIIDYARRRLILEPGPDSFAPFPERRSVGATFLADGPDYRVFRVTAVGANSAAARAGLQKDDIVTGVDGREAAALTLGGLRELMTQDGQVLKLRIRRKSEELTLNFVVERRPISELK